MGFPVRPKICVLSQRWRQGAGPRPQSGASFFAFSTVSVSSPVASSLAGAVGPHAAAVSGAALFHEECRQDPESGNRVLGLERMLRVKLQQEFPGAETASVSSGKNKGIIEIPEVNESELAATSPVCEDAFANNVHDPLARRLESETGLRVRTQVRVVESLDCVRSTNSLNSSVGVDMSACARAACALPSAAAPRSCSTVARLSDAVGAHAHASPMHCARNSGGTGGLLSVQKSTSYCLDNSWSDTGRDQGPTGRRCTKGGVSGPAEDFRPVSEVEAGVNFRPAGGVRGQVAGSLPRRQPGTGTRQGKGGVVTPSLHPEVPGIQFVSPGYGLDIRQSMGWTKVCGTTRSGIWVLKGNARTRMLPENLDHLRVGWISRGTYETAWVTPGHDWLCPYQYGRGAAVRPQTNDGIWNGVIGLWGRVAPLLSPWCARGNVPTEVRLNRYAD